ncbi:hypothetical protein SAMN05216289_11629 [Dokdonella immobilis]|uniref:Alpha/beta hydrolase n=2 Tax=Dokdonella immobilis TaxID=578942 RepID=A0A1I4YAT3_9GAMM|nr:hypothetical protein SAMN05216289_11629 [Dokdonella immobilis]
MTARITPFLLGTLLVLVLGGCAAGGDVSRPIPTATVAAPSAAHRAVIVLPGRGDDLDSLQRRNLAAVIQRHWPEADVILTGLTMPFYKEGRATTRLHDEVVAPMRERGYREIWLLGISLGGMGAILYEHEHPGETDGILLLSPYLGEAALQDEIRNAGGLAKWKPGPHQALGPDTFQRELWRTLKSWQDHAVRAQAIWLSYGTEEPFRTPIGLMAPALPADHVLALPGRHDWDLWLRAAGTLLDRAAGARVDAARGAREPSRTFAPLNSSVEPSTDATNGSGTRR